MKKKPARPVRPARPLAAPQLAAVKGGATSQEPITFTDDWEAPLLG